MSGHSKWSKIKHQKGVEDVKKGKTFSLLARLITQAVREGKSGNPNDNPHLRMILEKAREANLPKDNVQRAIDRGLGKGAGGVLADIVVEGYGPGGVAVIVSAITDNPNRTKAEIKTVFDRHRGNTGEPGSVAYVFSGADGAPSYQITLTGGDAEIVRNLLESLDELDDVEMVRHNAVLQ